jgi:DNA replication initiation complex subunit (GINS family)
LFSISEREKIEIQLNNVRKILADLYDRREKKIMSLAVNKSITNSHIIDTSNLLDSEKKMYGQLLGLLNHYRHTCFFSVLHPREQQNPDFIGAVPNSGEQANDAGDYSPDALQGISSDGSSSSSVLPGTSPIPEIQDKAAGNFRNPASASFPNPSLSPPPSDSSLPNQSFPNPTFENAPSGNPFDAPSSTSSSFNPASSTSSPSSQSSLAAPGTAQYPSFEPAAASPAEPAGSKIVRIMTPLPSFLGLHGETYGPFDEEDVANLPDRIAEILIKKGKAEDLSDSDNNSPD